MCGSWLTFGFSERWLVVPTSLSWLWYSFRGLPSNYLPGLALLSFQHLTKSGLPRPSRSGHACISLWFLCFKRFMKWLVLVWLFCEVDFAFESSPMPGSLKFVSRNPWVLNWILLHPHLDHRVLWHFCFYKCVLQKYFQHCRHQTLSSGCLSLGNGLELHLSFSVACSIVCWNAVFSFLWRPQTFPSSCLCHTTVNKLLDSVALECYHTY